MTAFSFLCEAIKAGHKKRTQSISQTLVGGEISAASCLLPHALVPTHIYYKYR